MTSLDMRTSVFFTTMLFGCKLHFQPLTPEEEEKVDDSIYRASLIQPYVISLAETISRFLILLFPQHYRTVISTSRGSFFFKKALMNLLLQFQMKIS